MSKIEENFISLQKYEPDSKTNEAATKDKTDRESDIRGQADYSPISPVTLNYEDINGDFIVGSLVQFGRGKCLRGVIKWIGHIGNPKEPIAGIKIVSS